MQALQPERGRDWMPCVQQHSFQTNCYLINALFNEDKSEEKAKYIIILFNNKQSSPIFQSNN